MRAALILCALLAGCGGGAGGETAPASGPVWQASSAPLGADERLLVATINGHTGQVVGAGTDRESRALDACAYMVQTYAAGSDVYRALLGQGQIIRVDGLTCKARQLPAGLYVELVPA